MTSKAKRNWDDVQFDEHGEVDVELTIEARKYDQGNSTGHKQTVYAAPEGLEKLYAYGALANMGLKKSALIVAIVLIYHANPYTGRCDPGLRRIMKITYLSERAVRYALRELEEEEVLKTGFRFRATSAYHVNWKYLRKVCEKAFSGQTPGGKIASVVSGDAKNQGAKHCRSGGKFAPAMGHGVAPKIGNRNRKEKIEHEMAFTSFQPPHENLRRDDMEDMETLLLPPEPTERPKEVCMEAIVSSSENQTAQPKISDLWESHLGPLSDPWVLQYFAPKIAAAEKVMFNRDSSPAARHEAVMKLCKYSGKIHNARRRAR